jgi:hypothetical protein
MGLYLVECKAQNKHSQKHKRGKRLPAASKESMGVISEAEHSLNMGSMGRKAH